MKDFSFQGKIYLGERAAPGRPGKLTWVGDQSSCQLQLSTDSEDRTETHSGKRLQSARLTTSITATLNLTLRYFSADNVKLGLYARTSNVAGATVPTEPFPADLAVGDQVLLARSVGVSDLVIKDSAASTPKTLVEGTDYRFDPESAIVTLLKVSGLTQPLTAAYKHLGFTSMPLFTADPPERYLFLDGVNTLDGTRIRMHLYRLRFDPVAQLDLINDSFGELALTAGVLFDSEAAADTTLGGFGRFETPSA